MEDWLVAWRQAAAKSEQLLAAIAPAALSWRPRARAWVVGQHFWHLHQARCDWITGQPGGANPAPLPKEASVDQERLLALAPSFRLGVKSLRKKFSFEETASTSNTCAARARARQVFVAYLVAHEAISVNISAWGEVGALLAQQGERLPRELAYGLWDWGDAG